jgi:CheY-like chemotaxis protein
MRERAELFNVPVLSIVAQPCPSEFRRAFEGGTDDVLVDGDELGAARRLLSLAKVDPRVRPAAARGLALVAAPDISRRRQLGRTLRQAGFEVAFASEGNELLSMSQTNSPALVVATPSFPPMGGDAALRGVRAATRNPELPGVVVGARSARGSGVRPAVADASAALMLIADRVNAGVDPAEQRKSKRVAYATLCSFRASGLMEPTYGMTLDVSRGGMYVRTLDPPAPGTVVWVELRTCEGVPVHLRGVVAWRRQPAQVTGAAPPGFGLRLEPTECPPHDLAAHVAGCDRLLRGPDAVN